MSVSQSYPKPSFPQSFRLQFGIRDARITLINRNLLGRLGIFNGAGNAIRLF